MPRRVYPNLHAYFRDNPEESQGDHAAALGISPALFSMIKWGQREPNLTLALAMVERFHIPFESLIRRPRKRAS